MCPRSLIQKKISGPDTECRRPSHNTYQSDKEKRSKHLTLTGRLPTPVRYRVLSLFSKKDEKYKKLRDEGKIENKHKSLNVSKRETVPSL